MKKIFTSAALICSFFIACNNNGQSINSSENSNSETEKKTTKRDLSVTAQNSYNDIFLDSSAVEKFLSEKKIPDSLTWRIRSFYNARNYQFAWFSSKGLTEQALAFWNIHNYETTTGDTILRNKALQAKMDDIVADSNFTVNAKDRSMINTELTLTAHFITHIRGSYEKGYVKRKEMERFIPIKKDDPILFQKSLHISH